MHAIQILVPLADNSGKPFPSELLKAIQEELVARFGGLTAYARAPAQGIWATGGDQALDDIVVVEVMADTLDKHWWLDFRRRVEHLLQQHQLVVRAIPIEML
jgi:hypothetical protein